MSNPSEVIKDLLVSDGVGVFAATTGWGIYIAHSPDKPDTCIVIRDTGGTNANPKYLLNYPSIQVMVRGSQNGYVTAYDKCENIRDVLLGLPSQDIGADRWVAINAMGGINGLGEDDNNRPLLSLNFALIIQPAQSGLTNRVPIP